MMGLFEHWPYVNFHDLNLDWIIKEIPKIFASRDEAQASAEASAESAAASQLSADAAQLSAESSQQSAQAAAEDAESLAGKARQVDLNSARINNILVQGTPTEGNAELIDIRVGANNKTYATAGDAVRGQYTDVRTKIHSLSDFYKVLLKVKNHSFTCSVDGVNRDTLGSVELTEGHTYYIRVSGKYDYGTAYQCNLELSRKATSQAETMYTQQCPLVYTIPKAGSFAENTTYTPSITQSYDFGIRFLNAIGNANQSKITDVTLTLFDATELTITETPELNKLIDESNEYVITHPTDQYDNFVIDCFGDSLTAGVGGDPYTTELQTLLGNSYKVNNYGVGGEDTLSILARMGAVPAIIDPTTIGSSSQQTELPVHSTFGYDWINIRNGRGANPVTIGGIKGNIYPDAGYTKLYFTPLGYTTAQQEITRPAIIYTNASCRTPYHTLVLFMGQNGGWTGTDPIEMLIDQYNAAVKYMKSEKYLFIGLTSGTAESRADLETKMKTIFSGHYINAREYLVNYGLSDNNLTPTEEDTAAISVGSVPPSLLSDSVHLNTYGYRSLAKCIYNRGKDIALW